ncbi:MAG: hypothetical protein B7C24_04400 [Bacteroidetes bacterium 4572_77]|nr:MAG: hypothetical protein B7C24_04400 [Bacteroidetes bacterium 4572_77]
MRIKGLDFLRGIAILLVLFRHNTIGDNLLYHFGWLGVDLFFVLSGFLVSGLLFKEYKRKTKVNIKRFLIRRAFKIYPPFYFFLIVSLALHYWETQTMYPIGKMLSELLYVQSYFPRIWIHTWSLAVEEHFYLVLSVMVFFLVKYKAISKKAYVIGFLLFLVLLSFLLRYSVSYEHKHDAIFGFVQTHLRADGIIIGVLISYLYHFTSFNLFFRKYMIPFLALAVLLILPGFIYSGGSFFMNTWGLSLVNLGFGIFTLWSVNTTLFDKRWTHYISLIFGFIGLHSYSIYLWHIDVLHLAEKWLEPQALITSLVFFVGAILMGSFFSIVLEKPFLKWRDRIMP